MKVRSVNPGNVIPMGNEWSFTIEFNGVGFTDLGANYPTASAAKQAMREKVAQERKRHGLN